MPQQQSPGENYLLGQTPEAHQRLLSMGQLFNPFTQRVLTEAGITTGMHVLDVGCGPGNVSLLAAALVGETGRVLGVDANEEVLQLAHARAESAGLKHLSFRAEDVVHLTLEQKYDAIIGRFILMHLPEPVAVLRRLTDHLRPGGVVAFQEMDLSSHADAFYPPSTLWEQVWSWCTQPFQQAGGELNRGLKLYRMFLDAGLPAPQVRYEAAIGSEPDWRGFEWWAESVRVFLPLIEQFGLATAEEIGIETLADRLREETVSQRGVARTGILVSAWVRQR
jgi:2-polyprenyl-3-methyl-5-hydroxy-6-metoxy-1,4-benzoquinol methylase